MPIEERISCHKEVLGFGEELTSFSQDLSEDNLNEVVRVYDHLETMERGVFDRIMSEGKLTDEDYGAGLALIDLQNHATNMLSEYFEHQYGLESDMPAIEAMDIIQNEFTDDEYEAYRIVAKSWDMEEDSADSDELWNKLIDSRLN